MDLDLSELNGIAEHPDHFALDHARHGAMQVPKSALPADVHSIFSSLAKGQAAADAALATEHDAGGVRVADTGDVVPDASAADAAPDADAQPVSNAAENAALPTGPSADAILSEWASPGSTPLTPVTAVTPPSAYSQEDEPSDALPGHPGEALPGLAFPGAANALAITKAALTPSALENESRGQADAAQEQKNEQPPAPPATTPAAQPPPNAGVGVGWEALLKGAPTGNLRAPALAPIKPTPFDSSEFDAYTKQQAVAAETHGRLANHFYNQAAIAQQQSNQTIDDLNATYKKKIDANAAETKALVDAYSSPQNALNPNRIFQSQTANQKLQMGIGILLSGFGAGLTHTPNQALQVIREAVNDDILHQESVRGGMMTKIRSLQAEGLSLQAARQSAIADATAKAAGALKLAAYRFAGPDAQAAAAGAAAKLMQEAITMKNVAALNDMKLKAEPMLLDQKRQVEQFTMQAEAQRANAATAQAQWQKAYTLANMTAPKPVANPVRDPRTGFVASANSPAEQTVAQNRLMAIEDARDAMDKAKAVAGSGTMPGSDANRAVKGYEERIQRDLKALQMTGARSEKGGAEQVPGFGNIIFGNAKAEEALEQYLNHEAYDNTFNNYTDARSTPGGGQPAALPAPKG